MRIAVAAMANAARLTLAGIALFVGTVCEYPQ
jgi:hypothetical protein